MAHHRFFSDALTISRRDMLRRCGTGFGALALADLMSQAGLLSAVPQGLFAGSSALAAEAVNPMLPKSPPLAAKAKHVIHIFLNGGASQVDTFDPKPALEQIRRQIAADGEFENRTQNRRVAPLALQVPEVWRKWHRSQRDFFARGRVHRRRGRDPFDARRCAQSRAVAALDELRRGSADSPQHGLLGHVWPGNGKSKPAGVHRDVPRRLSDSRIAKLAGWVSAGRIPGHVHRYASTPNIEKLIENVRTSSTSSSRASGSSWTCCRRSTGGIEAGAAARSAARSADPIVRAGLSHAERSGRGVRRQPRAAAHSRFVRRRHAGPANADRPAAGRARRALRAALARRRGSPGTATTISKSTTAAWPANAIRR